MLNNSVLYFLIGIFVIGLLTLGYYAKGSGALAAIAIVVGVVLALLAYFGGFFGEPSK